MPIEIVCHQCKKTLRVGDHVAGKKIRCPACQSVVSVPAEEIVEIAEVYEEPAPTPRTGSQSRQSRSGPRRSAARGRSPESRSQSTVRSEQRLREARTSRDYVHSQCGGITTIDGPEFQAMADPLIKMRSTYCSECEDDFPVVEFAWEDTQERISDYYARYQEHASPLTRFFAARSGMFTLSGAMFVVGLSLTLILGLWGILAAIVGAVVGIVLHVVVLGPMLLKRVLGTNDPRQLE